MIDILRRELGVLVVTVRQRCRASHYKVNDVFVSSNEFSSSKKFQLKNHHHNNKRREETESSLCIKSELIVLLKSCLSKRDREREWKINRFLLLITHGKMLIKHDFNKLTEMFEVECRHSIMFVFIS